MTTATGKWAEQHRDEVAKSLGAITGVPLDIQTVAANRSHFVVGPVTDDIVATQQGVADRFFKLGLIPKPIVDPRHRLAQHRRPDRANHLQSTQEDVNMRRFIRR